jgi:hypothetical protein
MRWWAASPPTISRQSQRHWATMFCKVWSSMPYHHWRSATFFYSSGWGPTNCASSTSLSWRNSLPHSRLCRCKCAGHLLLWHGVQVAMIHPPSSLLVCWYHGIGYHWCSRASLEAPHVGKIQKAGGVGGIHLLNDEDPLHDAMPLMQPRPPASSLLAIDHWRC